MRREEENHGGNWDATPRSESGYSDAPSVRVPNVGWDSTPRASKGPGGWGRANTQTWDATPRTARGDSPEGDGALYLDAREWEEEQVKLDRDWYTGGEEGTLAGDEEHNPLSQYEDLAKVKDDEIARKATKKVSARQAQYVSFLSSAYCVSSSNSSLECRQ